MAWWTLKIRPGQSLIELMVAMGLMAILLPAFLTATVASREGKAQQPQRTLGVARMQEAVEAVRSVREQGWTAFAVNGTYHPSVILGQWQLVTGSETTSEGMTRTVVIEDVNRDALGKIANVGTLDPASKKITVTVSWETPVQSEVSSVIYLTRYLDNLTRIETTYADFNAGVKTSTAVGYTNGSSTDGEITLSGGGHGDWCQPDLLPQVTLDLPKSGVANAISAIPATSSTNGIVFAGTGENASGVSFAKVNITDVDPPLATVSGTIDGYKTNGIFGEAGYAYIATDNNTKEVVIISLDSPFTESGYFNAPGNGNGGAVSTSGNTGYMTSANKFYTFDLSSKTGSRTQLGTVTLAGTATKIKIAGNYAYVTINNSATQLQVINVSNPSSPSIVAQAVNINDQGGVDVFINNVSTRAYLVTSSSTTSRELFILNINNPPSGNLTTLASFDTSGMSPTGVIAVTNNKVVVVGTGGYEYQVYNYDDVNRVVTNCPNSTGLLNIDAGIRGVATVTQPSGSVFSYIITGDSASELKII